MNLQLMDQIEQVFHFMHLSAESKVQMPAELRIDMMITYATEFLKSGYSTNPQLKIWEGIERFLIKNLDRMDSLPFHSVANIAMIQVQAQFDD